MDLQNPDIQKLINRVIEEIKRPHVYNKNKVFDLICGLNIYIGDRFPQLISLYYSSPLCQYNNIGIKKTAYIKKKILYQITKETKPIISCKKKIKKTNEWIAIYMKIRYKDIRNIAGYNMILKKINKNLGYMLYKIFY